MFIILVKLQELWVTEKLWGKQMVKVFLFFRQVAAIKLIASVTSTTGCFPYAGYHANRCCELMAPRVDANASYKVPKGPIPKFLCVPPHHLNPSL